MVSSDSVKDNRETMLNTANDNYKFKTYVHFIFMLVLYGFEKPLYHFQSI